MQDVNRNHIKIQKAKKDDAIAIIEYVRTVADETDFLTFDSSEFNKTVEEEQQIIEEHNSTKNKLFIIAKLDNKIIGVLNVQANKKKRLEHVGEFGVSVLKEHWNKGVGSSLVKYMIEWAKESGVIRKLNLRVLVNNESAIRIYIKNGFKIEGMIRRDIKLNNTFQDLSLIHI